MFLVHCANLYPRTLLPNFCILLLPVLHFILQTKPQNFLNISSMLFHLWTSILLLITTCPDSTHLTRSYEHFSYITLDPEPTDIQSQRWCLPSFIYSTALSVFFLLLHILFLDNLKIFLSTVFKRKSWAKDLCLDQSLYSL